ATRPPSVNDSSHLGQGFSIVSKALQTGQSVILNSPFFFNMTQRLSFIIILISFSSALISYFKVNFRFEFDMSFILWYFGISNEKVEHTNYFIITDRKILAFTKLFDKPHLIFILFFQRSNISAVK